MGVFILGWIGRDFLKSLFRLEDIFVRDILVLFQR